MMKLTELKNEMHDAMLQGQAHANAMMATKVSPKVDKLLEKKSGRFAIRAAMVGMMVTTMSTVAFASGDIGAVEQGITSASTQIYSFIKNILLSIGTVSLAVCGLVLLLGLGGQRASENAKSWAIRIFFGMAIVLMAEPIISWVQGLMQGGGN